MFTFAGRLTKPVTMNYLVLILLVVLGIFLMILDFLVIPGGIVAVVGILCMVGGVAGAFVEYGATIGFLTLVLTAILTVGSFVLMMRTKTWKKLQLRTKIDGKMNEIDTSSLKVGTEGVAISRLAPTGTGLFGDVEGEVVSLHGFLDESTPIAIRKIDGGKVYVSEIN